MQAAAPFDLVIAADILYEARNLVPVCVLLPLLAGSTVEVVVADPRQPDAQAFLERLAPEGWTRVTADIPCPDSSRRPANPSSTSHGSYRPVLSPQPDLTRT